MERFLIQDRCMSQDGDYLNDNQVYCFKFQSFNFNVDIQPSSDEISVSFGVKRSNDSVSMYKATYDEVSETWTLVEVTQFP